VPDSAELIQIVDMMQGVTGERGRHAPVRRARPLLVDPAQIHHIADALRSACMSTGFMMKASYKPRLSPRDVFMRVGRHNHDLQAAELWRGTQLL